MSAENSMRALGNPWTRGYLMVVAVAAVITMAIVSSQHAVVPVLSLICAFASVILAVLGWGDLVKLPKHVGAENPPSTVIDATPGNRAWIYLGLSFIAAGTGLVFRSASVLDWIMVLIPFALIIAFRIGVRRMTYSLLVIAPLLCGSLFLGIAAILGNWSVGAYPAAFATLFTFIIHMTHDLERRTELATESDVDPHVHIVHRKPLAWLSIVFFLFGVIDFWPWLGKTYGNAYFWILVLGVLIPLLYLWGRLRQPRRQNSYVALQRFNRVVPYLALIVLVAIALG